jgi:hypothetical protein
MLGVLVKRSYRIEPGARATPLQDQPEVYADAVEDEVAGSESFAVHETDWFAFLRPRTDVLLRGSAHSPRGNVTSVTTSVRVGESHKRIRAQGDRRLRVTGVDRLDATAAEGFSCLPIDWPYAYGGRDRRAEALIDADPNASEIDKLGVCTYPRNPAGRGFMIDAERDRLEGLLLPNLDDPVDPVEPERLLAKSPLDWIDRPVAASYGPIGIQTFPRCMFYLLRPDWSPAARPIRELSLGWLAEQGLREPTTLLAPIDPRLACTAPAGLAACRLEGHERVELENLHREHSRLEFDLPAERPRLFIEPSNVPRRELYATLQTLLIEPDQDRITLTWTGAMPVAAVFPESMCQEMNHAVSFER